MSKDNRMDSAKKKILKDKISAVGERFVASPVGQKTVSAVSSVLSAPSRAISAVKGKIADSNRAYIIWKNRKGNQNYYASNKDILKNRDKIIKGERY